MLARRIQEAIEKVLVDALRGSQDDALESPTLHPQVLGYVGPFSVHLTLALKELTGQEECLLFSSATAGLEITLRALGVTAQDEVLISGYDYPGNFWAVERLGAKPVLVDIEPNSWQLSLEQIKSALKEQSGSPKIKALIVSHLHGELQPMQALREICDNFGVKLIEDCCQAVGASEIDGNPVGRIADVMLLSFGGGKTISAGRGGAILTNDTRLAQQARVASGAGSGPYALSELQAAVLLAQIEFLDEIRQTSYAVFKTAESVQANHSSAHSTWLSPSLGQDNPNISFYQCGWLLDARREDGENEELLDATIANLRQHGFTAGRGFKGFHRRSARRCRVIAPLNETKRRVNQTLVVHHGFGLYARDSVGAQELAQRLGRCLANCFEGSS